MPSHLNHFQKGQIIAFKKAKKSNRWISKKLKVGRATVSRVLQRFSAGESLDRHQGSGRPRITTPTTDRLIIREVNRDPFATTTEIRETLATIIGGEEGSPTLSYTSIRRRIRQSGEIGSYWAAKKPFITEENKKKRVEWGLAHRHKTKEEWRKVLWTDESPYVLRYARKKRVWRRMGERFKEGCTIGTVKHDKKIMVWGCFAAHGVGHLHRVEGIMEQKQYKQILIHHMKPSMHQLFPRHDGVFQQDNDPKHTAKTVTRYLNNNRDIRKLPVIGNHKKPLRWPAQSPDLNPIENLWAILDHNSRKRKCNTKEQLMGELEIAWENLPVELLTKLVDSLPNRIEEMLANKGGATSY